MKTSSKTTRTDFCGGPRIDQARGRRSLPAAAAVLAVLLMAAGAAMANGHEEAEHDEHGHGPGAVLGKLIEPMGIVTISLVAATVLLGVFRRRWKPRLMLKLHMYCGFSALAAGVIHATLVLAFD